MIKAIVKSIRYDVIEAQFGKYCEKRFIFSTRKFRKYRGVRDTKPRALAATIITFINKVTFFIAKNFGCIIRIIVI